MSRHITDEQKVLHDKRLASTRKWKKTNRDKVAANNRKWALNNPQKVRDIRKKAWLKRMYGMDWDTYWTMAAEQGNLCYVCRKPETVTSKGQVVTLSVDHNHNTNEIRRLLCMRCNYVIGHVNEDVLLLQAMIDYILSYRRT